MVEIRLAVEKGHRILEIYEVFEYIVTRYDPVTREGVLYAGYIDTFMKLKSEATGYPEWVRNPAN
jgi:hypothetical protein